MLLELALNEMRKELSYFRVLAFELLLVINGSRRSS